MGLSHYKLQPVIPASLAPTPGAVPGSVPLTLQPIPQLYPCNGPTDLGFLYSQMQGMPFLGGSQAWSGTQTFDSPDNTPALVFENAGSLPYHTFSRHVGVWEIGTNSSSDGVDNDYYWLDLTQTPPVLRMRIDEDGQLTLPGYATINGVPVNNSPTFTLNQSCRTLDGYPKPVAGFGVGQMFRLPDGNNAVNQTGAIVNVLGDVTPGAVNTRFDFWQTQGGSYNRVVIMHGSGMTEFLATDANRNTILRGIQLQHSFPAGGPTLSGGGVELGYVCTDSSSVQVPLARMGAQVIDPTHGVVTSALYWTINYLGTEVEVMRARSVGMTPTGGASITGSVGGQLWIHSDLQHDGTNLGFYGTTAIPKPSGTTDLRAALIALGLYTSGGASPLNLNGGAAALGATTVTGSLTVSGAIGGASGAGLSVTQAVATPSADADYTLSVAEVSCPHVQINTGSWTAGHKIIFPVTAGGLWLVFNNSGYTATLEVVGGSGTGFDLANNKSAWAFNSGGPVLRRSSPDA